MKYVKRIIDSEIEDILKYMGAVYIKGPKWCGKTTSATQFAKSKIDLQNPDNKEKYAELAKEKISKLLDGEKPRLIDEWQQIPNIWNAVRYAVDNVSEKGQYILTGSATPTEDDALHPGTGRIATITMKPMTLYESGESNGKISLKDIIKGKRDIDGIKAKISYEELAYLVCRGGWPDSISLTERQALRISKFYIDSVCNSDISKVDGVVRNPALAKVILQAYARQVCTIGSNQSLYEDVRANFGNVSDNTIMDYLNVLKKLFLIEDIPAWNPNIRSKTSIRTSPKKTFVDPSLATALLETSPDELVYDVKAFGLLFENLVNRDLSVYANSFDGYIRHFRDRFGLECDNVIHYGNGNYGLIEVKLSGNGIADGEKTLLKLLDVIREYNLKCDSEIKKIKEPDFMMIITGTDEMAWTLKSGIMVVPIGCLKD